MTYATDDKVSAYGLRAGIMQYSALPISVSITSSTEIIDASGFVIPVKPFTRYAIDGYLAYIAGVTGRIKFALHAPSGVSGHWGVNGIETNNTSPGPLEAAYLTTFSYATPGAGWYNAGGDTEPLVAWLNGYILTGSEGGVVQLGFAQNTSNAAVTTIKAGSWLRLSQLT